MSGPNLALAELKMRSQWHRALSMAIEADDGLGRRRNPEERDWDCEIPPAKSRLPALQAKQTASKHGLDFEKLKESTRASGGDGTERLPALLRI